MMKHTAELIKSAGQQLPPGTPPDQVSKLVSTKVNAQAAQEYAKIGADSMFNVGELKSYIQNPDLQTLPLISKVLAPASAAGTPLSDSQAVMELGAAAVRNGLITSSEFSAGISQTYRKASLANIEARALTGFGITVPNSGKNYFISGGTFQAPIDLLDETSVNRWFLKNSFKQTAVIDSSAPVGMRNFRAPK